MSSSAGGSLQSVKAAAGMPNNATTKKSPLDLGSQYQGLLDANPYRNQSYQSSPWQNFLSALGFRTEADAWRENMSVQAAEYDAAIAQKAYDEQYDAAGSQVARLKAAGLNPDISGGQGVSAGEAATPAQDPSTPMQSTGEEGVLPQILSTAMSIGTACLNSVSTAVGIMGSIQGVRRAKLENSLLSLQNDSALQNYADQILPYILPTTPKTEVREDGFESTWKDLAYNAAKFFVGDMDKKTRSKFEAAMMARINSAPGEAAAYSAWRERVTSRKGYYQESSTFYDESDEVLEIISRNLGQMNEAIFKATQKADLASAEARENEEGYKKELYDPETGLNPKTAAAAQNAKNKTTANTEEIHSILRGTLKDMVKDLQSLSKEKGIKGGLASIAMSLISMIELAVSSGMIKFGI